MNKEDLFNMLKVKPQQVKSVEVVEHRQEDSQEAFFEKTVLKVDEWDLAQGEKLKYKNKSQLSVEAWSDFFSVAFQSDPILHERCIDERRRSYVKNLLESPETQSIRSTTSLCESSSNVFAVSLGEAYSRLLQEDQDRARKLREGRLTEEKAKRQAKSALIRAVMKVTEEADKEIEDLLEVQSALGMGPGIPNQQPLNMSKIGNIFDRIKNNRMLRAIFDRAGRFRRVAQAKQRTKTQHGYDDMVGIKLDDTIDMLLSEELACLIDSDLELDTMRRLIEKETLAYEYRGLEKLGKGPIIVCVDESGSMSGEPIANAKAFALSMAWVAQYQKRWIALVGYSGGTQGTLCVLKPGRWDSERLLVWLESFFGCGTELDIPLAELPGRYWNEIQAPKGKTDLILITDGICRVSDAMRDNFNEWKKREQVKCISLILAGSAGGLKEVSDEIYLIRNLGIDECGIEKCLSI